jgi:hypothetical protein
MMGDGHPRDKGWRVPMYAASPPGRLEAHEACISRMDADASFTFDIGMYRAQVEYARAELDRENWPETQTHLAHADTQITLIGWIHDEDRERGVRDLQARRSGAEKTNADYEDARAIVREKALEKWTLRPDLRKSQMIQILKEELCDLPRFAMPTDTILWNWLKDWPQRGQGSVIPKHAQKAGRPKSTGR